jgi:tetratricopeptide (TPR) repeat protein
MNWSKVVLLLVATTILAGCPRPPDEKTPIIELEPLFITILKRGDKVEVKDFDQGELFARAAKQFEAGHVGEARTTYLLIAREAPAPEVAALGWFNVALCEMALERPGAALEAVREARARTRVKENLTHLSLIELDALAAAGEWEKVKEQGPALVSRDMDPSWLAQVQLLVGRAEFQAGKLTAADGRYVAALEAILNSLPLNEQYGNSLLAETYYRRAQLQKRLFDTIKFRLPIERMSVDMSDKMALLRQSEEYYLNSVRTRHSNWSPRSGFEMAALYQGFALDLLQAEVPGDLTAEEVGIYAEELAKKVVPLLRKGQSVHANNKRMCKTYHFASPWCDKSDSKRLELEALEEELLRK